MPDWKQVVRRRMPSWRTKEDVVAELAHHLEETYEQARSAGLTQRSALRLTLKEVQSWSVLATEIVRAKQEGEMNHRTKSLWIPALLTFLGASASLMLCQFHGIAPRMLWFDHTVLVLYLPWLATLPVFGAAGAYLSRRAQGPMTARLAAALSPALIMLAVMLLILPWGLILDGLHFFTLVGFGVCLTTWVAIPALALLLGAMPFLTRFESRAATHA